MLTAGEVAQKIREHLAGRLSRSEIADWAYSQFMKQDAGEWYDPRHKTRIKSAIADVIAADDGEQFVLGKSDLERLIAQLEAD